MPNHQRNDELRQPARPTRRKRGYRPAPEGLEPRVVMTRLNLAEIFGNLTTNLITDAPTPFGIQFSGQRTQAGLGYATTPVGDVDNDGVTDFVVTEPGVNSTSEPPVLGGLATSRAYLVFGSRSTASPVNFLVNRPNERAGGLNSPTDPVPAAIAGEQFTEIGQNNYVNGADGFDFDGVVFETPNIPNSRLGASVAGLGDINSDGFDDFAIGAPNAPSLDGADVNGRVYIVYGATALRGINLPFDIDVPVTDNSVIPPTQSQIRVGVILNRTAGTFNGFGGEDLGASVAGLGNAFGNGGNDLIIGDPNADTLEPLANDTTGFRANAGIVYLIDSRDIPRAPATGDASTRRLIVDDILSATDTNSLVQSVAIIGTQSFERFGTSVASAGNVDTVGNPDNSTINFNEILIGSPDFNGTGRSVLVYGSPNLFAQRQPLFQGSAIVVIDPKRFDPSTPNLGTNGVPGAIFENQDAPGDFGFSVGTAGFFNNDGFQDFMIGSPTSNFEDGQVTLIYGRSGTGAPGRFLGRFTVSGSTISAQTGATNAPASTTLLGETDSFAGYDVSGVAPTRPGSFDRNSILIGAPLFDVNHRGRAYIIPGGTDLGTVFQLSSVATAAADTGRIAFDRTTVAGEFNLYVGASVGGMYDLNRPNFRTNPSIDLDGQADYVIGAPGFRVRSTTTPQFIAPPRAGGAFLIEGALADPVSTSPPPPPPPPPPGGGGGSGSGTFFRLNRVAELATPRFGETFIPTRANLSKFRWRPIPQRLAAQQYQPSLEFQARRVNDQHFSRRAEVRTVSGRVFRRGRFDTGVPQFTHAGPVIPNI